MEIKFKVKHKFKKIDNIINNLPKVVEESIEDVLKNIQTDAIRLERGHNSEGILIELVNTSKNEVKGRVYADPDKFMTDEGISYLLFEFFGTGEFAEKGHIGKTKHFEESGYTEWYIPKEKIKRPLSYPIKLINGVEFYVASGSKANHFLTDAEFKTRSENLDVVKRKIYSMFEEVCK